MFAWSIWGPLTTIPHSAATDNTALDCCWMSHQIILRGIQQHKIQTGDLRIKGQLILQDSSIFPSPQKKVKLSPGSSQQDWLKVYFSAGTHRSPFTCLFLIVLMIFGPIFFNQSQSHDSTLSANHNFGLKELPLQYTDMANRASDKHT